MEQKVDASQEFTLNNEKAAALIGKAGGGDSSALLALYDATNRLIFGLIMKILGDRASAEEILLDVYTQVWKHSSSYDPRILPLVWLVTLARNGAVARLYWNKRESRKQETAPAGTSPETTVDPELQKRARASLQSLASAQRELLDWSYYGGMSCGEMAAQIGKPLGAVKSHIRVGLGNLAERLRTA